MILISACNKAETEIEQSSTSIQKDTFYLLNRLTGDTIPTGVPFTIDGEWQDTSRFRTFSTEAHPFIEERKPRIEATFAALPAFKQNVYFDSLEVITPGIDTFDIPESLPVVLEERILKSSLPRRTAPMRHKENARYDIQYLDVDLGLNSSYINAVITTKNGTMWFGTPKGLSSFDGQFVTDYSSENGLPDDFVQTLFEDSKGNLWIGTQYGGLAKYDGKKLYLLSKKNGLYSNNIAAIREDSKGNIWIGMWGGGVAKFDGKTIMHISRNNGLFETRVTNIYVDSTDVVWIATNGRGLYQYDGKSVSNFRQRSGYADSYLTYMFIDSKGRIWPGNWVQSTYIENNKLYQLPLPPGVGNFPMTAIFEDSRGNIWTTSFINGIICFDGQSIFHLKEEVGLTNNNINGICEDPAGNIWFATQGGGLCKYNPNSFNYFVEADGMTSRNVNAYAQMPDGRVMFGTDGGMTLYDDSTFYNLKFTGVDGEITGKVGDILVDKDTNIWVSILNCCTYKISRHGIVRYTDHHGMIDHNVMTIAQRKNGDIWFGSMGVGVGRLDERGFTNFNYRSGLNNYFIQDLLADQDDNLWIATDGEGVTKFDGTSFTHYTTNEGLIYNQVNALYEDEFNNIWIATKKGLSYFKDNKFYQFPAQFKLPDLNISAVVQDKKGNYWITTANGILFLKKNKDDAIWNPANYSSKSLTISDGLMGMDFIPRSVFVDIKNRVWLGGGRGLLMKNLTVDKANSSAPGLALSTVKINSQFIDYNLLHDTAYTNTIHDGDVIAQGSGDVAPFTNFPQSLKLPYYLNHLTFVFAGKNWHSDKMTYSYFLEGFDKKWSVPNLETWAEYRNLSYGKYVFKVKAIGEGELESGVLEYKFEILPPWWHTWWARLLFIVVLIFIVRWIVKLRTKKLREKQVQLERAVEERTQQLNSKNVELQKQYVVIEEQKVEAEKRKVEIEHQHTLLEETHKEIRDSIIYAKRIQEAILPNDNLVNELLPENFIYYLPKDVVAGDFYWIQPLEKGVLFAAADCTGHGVPGAMVSVVCNNALNRSVKEFSLVTPNEILNKTRELVIETFDKKGARVNDGMDIGLCLIDTNAMELSFAGANNSLVIIRNNELIEIPGDKQPVGKYDKPLPFSLKTEKLKRGDLVYLFTDGFADQFGGPKGKKLKSKVLKDLLLSISELGMAEQKNRLAAVLEDWKGDLEQVDDISLFGFKI